MIKRELSRSIPIFIIAFFTSAYFLSRNPSLINTFYWLIFVIPFSIVIIYMAIVILLLKKRGESLTLKGFEIDEHREQEIVKYHRGMVGSIVGVATIIYLFAIFLLIRSDLLLFRWIWPSFLVASFVLFVFFTFFNNKKIWREIGNNKQLICFQRKTAFKEIIAGVVSLGVLTMSIIVFFNSPIGKYIVPISLLIFIPIGFYIGKLEKEFVNKLGG